MSAPRCSRCGQFKALIFDPPGSGDPFRMCSNPDCFEGDR